MLLGLSAAGPLLGAGVAVTLAVARAEAWQNGGVDLVALLLFGGAVACGLWLLPTHALSLVAGWCMGGWLGSIVALSAVTLAAPLGHVVAGALVRDGVDRWLARYPRGAAVCEAITRGSWARAVLLVAMLRLSPAVPFGAFQVLSASFKLPIQALVPGTLIGMAPRVVAVVWLGAGLEQLDLTRPSGVGWAIAGGAATLLAVALMGWVTRGALKRMVPG